MSSPPTPEAITTPSVANGDLTKSETFWRNQYLFLKDQGYTLRKRYQPDWTASWLNSSKSRLDCEDGVPSHTHQALDATRTDGSQVILKRIEFSVFAHEIAIGKHFSSEPLASNSKNHCVPILDVIYPIEGSDTAFIVMPILQEVQFVPFQTVGETVELFRQIFEGLQFMHENNVAHGDCKYDNIMANTLSLFDSPPHPLKPRMKLDWSGTMTKPTSRTKRPVKYYFIDFDLSRMYEPEEHRLETPPWGGDKTVPEFLIPNPEPCDPFPVDVYCLGNAIRRSFLDGYEEFFVAQTGLEFMRELITDMVKDDPKARPTMAEVVERFDKIVQGLSSWRLRSPVVRVDKRLGFFGSAAHWIKQLCYMARRLPAIPKA